MLLQERVEPEGSPPKKGVFLRQNAGELWQAIGLSASNILSQLRGKEGGERQAGLTL